MEEIAEPKRAPLERWCSENGHPYLAEEWTFDVLRCCWTHDDGARICPNGAPWSGAED